MRGDGHQTLRPRPDALPSNNPEIPDETKEALTRTYLSLNPAQLKREIARCQERLLELGRTKHDRKGGAPPTRPPLQEDVLLAPGFEDIFDEATVGAPRTS
jgi:hypothetical protein